MDRTAKMQTRTHNETAHILPTCRRIPILLLLHTFKQSLTNFITSTNLELLLLLDGPCAAVAAFLPARSRRY